jgi:hypothetical protein
MKRFRFFALPLGITVIACSSSSSSSVSVDQACADYANALCTKANTCGALFVELAYGDVATCMARFKPICASAFAAKGTSITTSRAEACVTAFGSAGCDAIFDRNTPSDCRATPGTLANGTACGDDNQCASAYCHKAANATCGTCGTARAKAGEACAIDENCDYGLACAASVCVARGQSGATCDAGHPCASALYCKVARGATSGTCATPAAEGAMCSGTQGEGCLFVSGDFCNPKTSVCQKAGVASGGASCGYDAASGNFTFCSANGTCRTPMGSMMGTCLAAAADGAMCDATNGPKCMAGSTCVSAVCQKQDPSTCQ